jgi:hypothetical protein
MDGIRASATITSGSLPVPVEIRSTRSGALLEIVIVCLGEGFVPDCITCEKDAPGRRKESSGIQEVPRCEYQPAPDTRARG